MRKPGKNRLKPMRREGPSNGPDDEVFYRYDHPGVNAGANSAARGIPVNRAGGKKADEDVGQDER